MKRAALKMRVAACDHRLVQCKSSHPLTAHRKDVCPEAEVSCALCLETYVRKMPHCCPEEEVDCEICSQMKRKFVEAHRVTENAELKRRVKVFGSFDLKQTKDYHRCLFVGVPRDSPLYHELAQLDLKWIANHQELEHFVMNRRFENKDKSVIWVHNTLLASKKLMRNLDYILMSSKRKTDIAACFSFVDEFDLDANAMVIDCNNTEVFSLERKFGEPVDVNAETSLVEARYSCYKEEIVHYFEAQGQASDAKCLYWNMAPVSAVPADKSLHKDCRWADFHSAAR